MWFNQKFLPFNKVGRRVEQISYGQVNDDLKENILNQLIAEFIIRVPKHYNYLLVLTNPILTNHLHQYFIVYL